MSTISLVASKNTRLQLTHLLAEQRCRTKSGACPASPQPPRPPHAPRKVGSHWLGFCWPLDGTRPFKFRLKATHPAFLAPSDAQTGCNLEDPILAILAKRAKKNKKRLHAKRSPPAGWESQLVRSQLLGLRFQPLKRHGTLRRKPFPLTGSHGPPVLYACPFARETENVETRAPLMH